MSKYIFYKDHGRASAPYVLIFGIILEIILFSFFMDELPNSIFELKVIIPSSVIIFTFIFVFLYGKRINQGRIYLEIDSLGFKIKNKFYAWNDVDFLHYSKNYTQSELDIHKALLIFIKGKYVPIILNFLYIVSDEDARLIGELFDKFVGRQDLWKNKLQKKIWE